MSNQQSSPKKRLFLIINRLALSGGSMDALTLAFFLKDRYEVTVVYGQKEEDEKEAPLPLHDAQVTFIKINTLHRAILPAKDVQSYRQIRALLRQYQPHIVHTHGFKTGLLGRLAAHRAGVPVVIHTYHGHLFHSYYNRFVSGFIVWVERKLAEKSTRIIAISPQQAHELATTYRIAPEAKINTVFIGIDEKKYTLAGGDKLVFRSQYHIAPQAVVIALISRLVPIKNLSFFVEIIQATQRLYSNVCFVVIGDGSCKTGMQQQLQQKGIAWRDGTATPSKGASVVFTSWITHISEALQSIDIVVLTSHNEGTPVSLIEAQLFGIPVVATNVGGVRDTMQDGETGYLVQPFSVDEFVQKLGLLIDNAALRSQLGNKGHAFVKSRFLKTKEAAAMDEVYRQCLAEKGIV